jgi:hypothetical protein
MKLSNSLGKPEFGTIRAIATAIRCIAVIAISNVTRLPLHAQTTMTPFSVDFSVSRYAGEGYDIPGSGIAFGLPDTPTTDSGSMATAPLVYGPSTLDSDSTLDPYYAGSASATAFVFSGFGVLRAATQATASAGWIGLSDVKASWTDTVTVAGTIANGIDGTWTPNTIGISGSGSASEPGDSGIYPWGSLGSAQTTYTLSMQVQRDGEAPQTQMITGGWLSDDGTGGFTFVGDPVGTQFSSPFIITYGQAFTFTVALEVVSTVATFLNPLPDTPPPGPDFFGSTEGDFQHTLVWQGMGELRDGNGDLVEGYTVLSESGTDWTMPAVVPEPGTAALAGLGFVLFAALGRFRGYKSQNEAS